MRVELCCICSLMMSARKGSDRHWGGRMRGEHKHRPFLLDPVHIRQSNQAVGPSVSTNYQGIAPDVLAIIQ